MELSCTASALLRGLPAQSPAWVGISGGIHKAVSWIHTVLLRLMPGPLQCW